MIPITFRFVKRAGLLPGLGPGSCDSAFDPNEADEPVLLSRIATPAEPSEPIKRGQRGLGAVISLMAAESYVLNLQLGVAPATWQHQESRSRT